MMKMFNQRFKIQRPTMAENEFGEQVQTLTLIGTRWGEVKSKGGDFYPAGTSQKWLEVLQVKTKHYPDEDIFLDDLIEYDGKQYRILGKSFDEDTFKYYVILKVTGIE